MQRKSAKLHTARGHVNSEHLRCWAALESPHSVSSSTNKSKFEVSKRSSPLFLRVARSLIYFGKAWHEPGRLPIVWEWTMNIRWNTFCYVFFSSVFSKVFSIGDSFHLYHSICPSQIHRPTLAIPPFHQKSSKSGGHFHFDYKQWKLGSERERRTLANFPRIVAFGRADSQLSNGVFASSVGPKVNEIKPFELV